MLKNPEGVSSVIGAVLMISLVVVAVAVISAMLLSQPTAEEIPELSVIAGVNPDTHKFTIFHQGGDSLKLGTFSLMLDSGTGYEDKTDDFTLSEGGDIWSIGEYMTYDYSTGSVPVGLKIVYHGKSGDMLLTSAPIAYSGNTTEIEGDTDVGGGVEYIPVTEVPEFFAHNTSACSILYFIDAADISFSSASYMEFTITDTPSSFTVNDMIPRELAVGDTLRITTQWGGGGTHGDIYVIGLGNMIYVLKMDGIYVQLNGEYVRYSSGGWPQYANQIYHAHFNGYDRDLFESTLTGQVRDNRAFESYMINDTLINEGYTNNICHWFYNMRPSDTGAFIVNSQGSNTGFYFVGMAEIIEC